MSFGKRLKQALRPSRHVVRHENSAVRGREEPPSGMHAQKFEDLAFGNANNTALTVDRNDSAPARSSPSGSEDTSKRSLTDKEQKCLDSFLPVPSSSRQSNQDSLSLFGRESYVNENTPSTLSWLETDTSYTDWRAAESSQLLLVSGYAGCGKSVLSFYVKTLMEKRPEQKTVVCRYFLNGTVRDQSSTCSLMRSLIHQLVTRRCELAPIMRKAFEKTPTMLSDFQSLWTLFEHLATHKQTGELWLIIDALDECTNEDQQDLIGKLAGLSSRSSPSVIKIFATCRTHSSAASNVPDDCTSATRLRLEDKAASIRTDVHEHIEQQVAKLVKDDRIPSSKQVSLETALKDRAEATFLWVSLVLSILKRRRIANKDDIRKIVDALPTDLERVYESILSAIPEENSGLANRVLQAIGASSRRLTVGELNAIVSIKSDHRSLAELRSDSSLYDERFVERLLEGLVRIHGHYVTLVHLTLKEFLANRDKGGGNGHHLLAEGAIKYLLLEDFQFDLFQEHSPTAVTSFGGAPDDDDDLSADLNPGALLEVLFREPAEVSAENLQAVAERFELFDYAARFWHWHFAMCQQEAGPELKRLAIELYTTERQESWYDYLRRLKPNDGEYPRQPDSLTMACYFGHTESARTLLLEHDSMIAGVEIYWAARQGHVGCLRILLPIAPHLPERMYYNGQCPLAVASARGHLDCVRCLLSADLFPVNYRSETGRTALFLAAAEAHLDVMSELLAVDETDPNIPDRRGATALFEAVRSESAQAVRKLLTGKRTNAGHMDAESRSPLSWACEAGLVETVKILLLHFRTGQKDKSVSQERSLVYGSGGSERDIKGRTPLMYAVFSSNLDVVRLILREGSVTISDSDNDGRNTISLAAQRRSTEILQYLLNKDPPSANAKDHADWVPFAWTLDPPERLANAGALLPYVRQHLDGEAGVTMFALAVRWGALRIACFMIRERVFQVNSTSKEGRTALSFAAEHGSDTLVSMLLQQDGVDVNLSDGRGLSPVEWARLRSHTNVERLLTSHAGDAT